MASAAGIAPPDSDVPAPRGTILTPSRCANCEDRRDLGRRLGQHDGERPAPIGRQRIGLVGREPHVVVDDVAGGDEPRSARTMSPRRAIDAQVGIGQADHGTRFSSAR